MTKYTRPSVYRISYSIDVFNGHGGIECLGNDFTRYNFGSYFSEDHPVEYFRAIEDGINQLHFELDKYHQHILERIREVEGGVSA